MKDLIERLERASGPDKILDCDIRAAVEGWRNVGGGYREWPDGRRERHNYGFAEPYTASLDSALSLVPEGWCSLMAWNPTDAICTISIKPLGAMDNEWPGDGRAPTPALAMCIAALKARMAAERDLTQEASNG